MRITTTLAGLILFLNHLNASNGPEIFCRGPISTAPDPGSCSATGIVLEGPLVFELPGCPVVSSTYSAPATFPTGVTEVVWTVTDACGNVATCIQYVIINDQEAPELNCQSNLFLPANGPNCNSTAVLAPPVVSDNCSGVFSLLSDAPYPLPYGTTQVTWTAIDASGNVGVCTQLVTVADLVPPALNCPPNLSVNSAGCGTNVFWNIPPPTDNCGGAVSVASTAVPGSFFEPGITTVTYTATDAVGNSATCSFTVQVAGTSGATGFDNCPDNITVASPDCESLLSVSWIEPTPNSLCYQSVGSNHQPGDLFGTGTTTVVYTLDAGNGATYTCSFEIEVLPAELSLVCPADTVIFVEAGETEAQVSWELPFAATDCALCLGEPMLGFTFLGDFQGHSYYLFEGGDFFYVDAVQLAADQGGYLAVITSAAENAFLESQMTNGPAFIGLDDEDEDNVFTWITGEPVIYTNFNAPLPTPWITPKIAVFLEDGTWDVADFGLTTLPRILIEIPCLELEQSGGIQNGGIFPLGVTEITYSAEDECGNFCSCSFTVTVASLQPRNHSAPGTAEIDLVPNPAQADCTVIIPETVVPDVIRILDPYGQVVYQGPAQTGDNYLPLSGMPPGYYRVVVFLQNGRRLSKLLILTNN